MPRAHVLVNGIGSYNGGAELLLRAASERLPRFQNTVYADGRRTDSSLRTEWDVRPYWSVPRLGRFESLGLSLIPRKLQRLASVGSSSSMTAVLDASGFAVGDQWGSMPIHRSAAVFERYSQRGVPVVLLPQAFGPFTRPEIASAARRLFASVSLAYARDHESLHHVRSLMGPDYGVETCPDITVALSVHTQPNERGARGVAIVPNINLVKKSQSGDRTIADYVDALLAMYDSLNSKGLRPYVMLHSRHGDNLVLAAMKELRPEVRTVVPSDGLQAKIEIGKSQGVISGRFHALVSALSQAVPTVAHSWSHKYAQLLSDFGLESAMADPFSPDESIERLEAQFRKGESARSAVLQRREVLSSQIETMWRKVLPIVEASAIRAKS